MPVKLTTARDGIGVLEVRGPLLGGDEIDVFRNGVNKAIAQSLSKLVIDITDITFINSAAVGVLVSALISYSRRGWQIRLAGVNKAVYTILKVTKLNLALQAHDTREEAVKSFV